MLQDAKPRQPVAGHSDTVKVQRLIADEFVEKKCIALQKSKKHWGLIIKSGVAGHPGGMRLTEQ